MRSARYVVAVAAVASLVATLAVVPTTEAMATSMPWTSAQNVRSEVHLGAPQIVPREGVHSLAAPSAVWCDSLTPAKWWATRTSGCVSKIPVTYVVMGEVDGVPEPIGTATFQLSQSFRAPS